MLTAATMYPCSQELILLLLLLKSFPVLVQRQFIFILYNITLIFKGSESQIINTGVLQLKAYYWKCFSYSIVKSLSGFPIPLTGYVKFSTGFVTVWRQRRRLYKVYIYMYTSIYICIYVYGMISETSWVDLAMSVCLSFYTYLCEIISQFLRYPYAILHTSFSHQELLISRNQRYRSTVIYSCYTNWPIKIKFLHGNYLFGKVSSLNLAWVIVQGNTTISEHIVQIATLKHIAIILYKLNIQNQVLVWTSFSFNVWHRLLAKATLPCRSKRTFGIETFLFMKGFLASVQQKLTFLLVFVFELIHPIWFNPLVTSRT